jgi:glycosyltransferase involved in cell wall biosynthesis
VTSLVASVTRRVHYVLVRFPKLSETFVLREMLELERAGWSVAVDTLEAPLDEPRDPALAQLRARVRRLPERPPAARAVAAHIMLAARRPRAWLWSAARAVRERRVLAFIRAGLIAVRAVRARADLFHVHFAYYSAEYASDAAELAGIPFTVFAHANDIWSDFNAPHLGRRLLGSAGVATGTRYNAVGIRSRVPGVDARVLTQVPPAASPMEVSPDGPVLAVARLVPKKGIDTLVEACARANEAGSPFEVEVLGEGPLLDELVELARSRGVGDRVRFRGACPPGAVSEAYARCSLFAMPCRIASDGDRDGLPTTLLEAMARGLPVVTSDVIGIPELVRHEENGLLVPPDDPEALAAAVTALRRDEGLAARLGAEARRTIERAYRPSQCAEEVRRWLDECARGPTPRATLSAAGPAPRS